MHNAAFAEAAIDYAYLAFEVKTSELCAAIQGMRALGIKGLNVTIPHKVAVVQFLDELDPLARDIGAVNTIVNEGGKLKGYNTDAAGFLRSLEATGFETSGKKVVMLGAGGAARAMGFALAQSRARITILNRAATLSQAVLLGTNLEHTSGSKVTVLTLDTPNLKSALADANLLVNATSSGMYPAIEETPVPAGLLNPGLMVFDVVYAPIETRLLREAGALSCRVMSGLEMLVLQAALTFELWTGQEAPVQVMRDAALAALGPGAPATHARAGKIRAARKTNIALVGFMGSGKTSVGKALAGKTGRPFIDLDALVEEKAGKSISRIFKEEGEPAFRKLEKAVTAEATAKDGWVIACGGGVFLDKSNAEKLKNTSVIVYLKASNAAIRKRVSTAPGKRPLLQTQGGADVISLLEARAPLYEQSADITLDTTRLGIERAADKIIERLGEYEGINF
jgi:shikimate dehydrogenase